MKSEAAVQREVVRYLGAHGWEVFPVGQWIAKRTQRSGVPDLWVMHPTLGISGWIEVKREGGGRISTAQHQFREWCLACGVRHAFVYSWRDVVALWQDKDTMLGVKNLDSNIGPNIGHR